MPYKQYLPTQDQPSVLGKRQPTRPGQQLKGGSPTEAERLQTKKELYGPSGGVSTATPGQPMDFSQMIKFKDTAGNQYDEPPGDVVDAKGTTPYKKGGPVKHAKGGSVTKTSKPAWRKHGW